MIRACFVAALVSAMSLPVHGYYYMTCDGDKIDWEDDNSITLRASAVSFDWDPPRAALDRQIDRFNFNPSKFRLNVSHGDSGVGTKNNQNEIWASDNQDLLKDRSGVTLMRYKCTNFKSEMLEADVLLQADPAALEDDKDFEWTFSDDRASLVVYGGDNRSIRTTMMHEFGHVAALLHTIETYGVMGDGARTTNTNGNRARTYFGEDGASGLIRLYGTANANIEDLAVSHWKFKSAGDDPFDDYSNHERTVVYDSNGDLIEDYSVKNGERHYEVEKGQTIRVEFTYENSGQDEQQPEIGFFLSGNNTISTGDLFLRDSMITVNRNSAYTTSKSITIPAWVPSGYYFVGAIIDFDKQINEQTGSNNTSYIGIRVLKGIDTI